RSACEISHRDRDAVTSTPRATFSRHNGRSTSVAGVADDAPDASPTGASSGTREASRATKGGPGLSATRWQDFARDYDELDHHRLDEDRLDDVERGAGVPVDDVDDELDLVAGDPVEWRESVPVVASRSLTRARYRDIVSSWTEVNVTTAGLRSPGGDFV